VSVPVGIKNLHATKGIGMITGSHAHEDFALEKDDVAA